MKKKSPCGSTVLALEAARIFAEGGKLRSKHLPAITGICRTKMESLLRDGSGPAFFQAGPGCLRIFDSVDVKNWVISKKRNVKYE